MNEKIDHIKKYINDNPKLYPFIAKKWKFTIEKDSEADKKNMSEYMKFKHIPFYKPFSKIVNFDKIDD